MTGFWRLFVLFFALIAPSVLHAFELDFPLDCKLGKDCFIQHYVDMDTSPATTDYTCKQATYDGHKGTDFRLISTRDIQRRVAVRAAADGIVKGTRYNMPDRLFTKAGAAAIKGRECGNGVVLTHGNGWETQYCHLRQGSVRVRRGMRVKRGTYLGNVGYSGMAAFAHLHLSVRRNKRVIDPFTGRQPDRATACSHDGQTLVNTLWSSNSGLRNHMPSSIVIETMFMGSQLKKLRSEAGLAGAIKPTRTSPALIFAVRLINLEFGDQLKLSIIGQHGFKVTNTTRPLTHSKANYLAFVGKKRRERPWSAGRYRGRVTILRLGRPVGFQDKFITLR